MNSSPPEALVTPLTSALPKARKDTPSLLTYRLMIFYRFALALVGGYVVAMLSAIVIADVFSEDRGSAAMSATLIASAVLNCLELTIIGSLTLEASSSVGRLLCISP